MRLLLLFVKLTVSQNKNRVCHSVNMQNTEIIHALS